MSKLRTFANLHEWFDLPSERRKRRAKYRADDAAAKAKTRRLKRKWSGMGRLRSKR